MEISEKEEKQSKKQEYPTGCHSAEIRKRKALESIQGNKNKQQERRNCIPNSNLAATATKCAGGGCPALGAGSWGRPGPTWLEEQAAPSRCLSGYSHSEKSVSSEAIKLSLSQRQKETLFSLGKITRSSQIHIKFEI